MNETTLTDSPSVEPESPDTGLLSDTGDTSAEVEADETQTDPQGTDETVSTDVGTDPDVANWLQAQNIDPTDPAAVAKLAKIARDNQKAARARPQNIQAELNADPAIQEARLSSDDNPELTEIRQQLKETQFFLANPDAATDEMKEAIVEAGRKHPALAYNFDLDTLYAIAKAEKMTAQHAQALKEAELRGREAVKKSLAATSAAKAPSGNAQVPTSGNGLTREAIANMSASEYQERRAEIQAAFASGIL